MHVLDIGCGTGDVTFLVADLVGPTGSVIGVDRSAEALRTARAREHTPWVRFLEADATRGSIAVDQPVDALVGRLVLAHQQHPASVLRRLAHLVRPGGVVACLELAVCGAVFANPARPILQHVVNWTSSLSKCAGMRTELGLQLASVFVAAGLPAPSGWLEPVTSDGDEEDYIHWVIGVLTALRGFALHHATPNLTTETIEELERRLLVEARDAGGCACAALAGVAWTRLPAH
jgi:SAM-dependent methyltransferase